jgi:hypothetical protein
MDMLRWHLLHPLGQLLTDVAQVRKVCSKTCSSCVQELKAKLDTPAWFAVQAMGARYYVERYQRDLALDVVSMAATGVSGSVSSAHAG